MDKQAMDDNVQILAHCNGDAAGDQFLNSIEKMLPLSDNPNKENLRFTMIHCQTARKDQIERMAKLKMVPSIFVGHVNYWGDVHVKNFGAVRGNRVSPVKDALDAGLMYNFHTEHTSCKTGYASCCMDSSQQSKPYWRCNW